MIPWWIKALDMMAMSIIQVGAFLGAVQAANGKTKDCVLLMIGTFMLGRGASMMLRPWRAPGDDNG